MLNFGSFTKIRDILSHLGKEGKQLEADFVAHFKKEFPQAQPAPVKPEPPAKTEPDDAKK
jgi:hypothetical protein